MDYMDYIDSMKQKVYDREITPEEYHIIMGKLHGYKECCIKNFINLTRLDYLPALFMHVVLDQHHDQGHVMCPICYEKYNREHPNREHETMWKSNRLPSEVVELLNLKHSVMVMSSIQKATSDTTG